MSPELAARVEAAVTGRPVGQSKLSPRLITLLRAGAVGVVVVLVVWVAVARRQSIDELEAERKAIIAQLEGHASQLTDADRATVPRIEKWVGQHADAYEGDLVADALRDPSAFST